MARYARPCDDGREFAGWLRTLASSALNDCRRRRRSFWSRFVTADRGGETAAAPIELSESDHVFLALDQALARLGAEERALLQEKYFSGADVRSLAARFDITPKALESRLTRARAVSRARMWRASWPVGVLRHTGTEVGMSMLRGPHRGAAMILIFLFAFLFIALWDIGHSNRTLDDRINPGRQQTWVK